MRLIALHSALWFLPVAALLGALAPWPYGYYQLLRIVICVVAGLIAFAEYSERQRMAGWGIAFGLLAFVFNPLIPLHLSRGIWAVLNVGGAVLFLAHWLLVRRATKLD